MKFTDGFWQLRPGVTALYAQEAFDIAETTDTHEPYFHAFNKIGYDISLIRKWDYLAEVLPGYAISTGHHKK